MCPIRLLLKPDFPMLQLRLPLPRLWANRRNCLLSHAKAILLRAGKMRKETFMREVRCIMEMRMWRLRLNGRSWLIRWLSRRRVLRGIPRKSILRLNQRSRISRSLTGMVISLKVGQMEPAYLRLSPRELLPIFLWRQNGSRSRITLSINTI